MNGAESSGTTVTGNVVNIGTIAAETENLSSGGIVIENGVSFQGRIENSGIVTGPANAIVVGEANHNLRLVNRGEISSDGIGIKIDGALNGAITNNRGLIQGGEAAIDASEATGGVTLNNQGRISGDVILSDFDDILGSSGQGLVNGAIVGLAGNDVLVGGRSNDALNGGIGDDTLTGGIGNDSFIFDSLNFGSDTVTDFRIGSDTLDLSALSLGSGDVTDLLENAQQVGQDTVLTLGDSSIQLQGVRVNQLSVNDFTII